MVDQITEDSLERMIEVGDRKNRGYVDQDDFMYLMKEIGLLPDPEKENDLEKAYRAAKEKRIQVKRTDGR